MNLPLNKIIRTFILLLWAVTLVLLVVGLIFLFSGFRDNELFTRVLLSIAAMMSVISLAGTIWAMIKSKDFAKQKVDEKANLKFKLRQINESNKQLYFDTAKLAKDNDIEMLDIEFVDFDNIELANHFNEELTIENSRIRNEIELKKYN
ncbi:MAG: hypothetical protein K5923_04990 [Clostridia bacterium]|nr:hypothetical protein [Clostridia bacterium]